MDSVRSLCYTGPWMGHVILHCIGWVLDRASHIKETMSYFFFLKLWILVNGTKRCGIELHDIHRHSVG